MTDISLKQLSHEIKVPIKDLLKELVKINIKKKENDSISIIEKKMLIKYLEKKTHDDSNTFIIQRKQRSTLNVSTISGKNKSIPIEVRKKRTYIKNNKLHSKILLKKHILLDNQEKKSSQILNKINIQEKKHEKNNVKLTFKNSSVKFSKTRLLKSVKNFQTSKKDEIIKKTKRHEKTIISNLNSKKNIKYTDIPLLHAKQKKEYNEKTTMHVHSNEKNVIGLKNLSKKNTLISKNIRKKKRNKNFLNQFNQDDVRVFNKNKKNAMHRKKSLLLKQHFKKPDTAINRDVTISSTILVSDLANKMAVKSAQVIKTMMNMGIISTINDVLDQDTAQLIAEEMGHKVILHRENQLEEMIMKDRDTGDNIFINRAPVVTIMGHVDHGKTSLLDYIRSTKIAHFEEGGITQKIGAYSVNTDFGMITFLDTPGHSAFTSMRSRGVQVTDIVVLVVAADDGIKTQTIEAIQHAKEASVPVIVAINKIDKTNANTDKIKNDLMQYNIHAEDLGGENIFVSVSSKTGQGIQELLNAISLQAEILELKAVANGMAEGVVIESFLDQGRGPIATVLVKKGQLHKGNIILCGFEYGRIKSLRDYMGNEVMHAGPSTPVEVLGLSKVPFSGDIVTVVRDEKKAREVAFYRKEKSREVKLLKKSKINLENMFKNMNKREFSELKIILKSDVQGSLEAISSALLKLSTDEVKIKIIGLGIGGITETDASLASASNAIILGFNVRADASAKRIINKESLDVRYYSVIYNLIDEVQLSIKGLLSPKYKQNILGLAEVRHTFKSPKFGFIAGCMVTEGIIKRNNPIRVLRDNTVIYEGELESLRRFKEDVNEIRNGLECGIGIKNYHDIRVKDVIEVFELKIIEK